MISRFVEERFFITTETERQHYLRLLGRALAFTDWSCLAYAVMSSHIHLAMVAGRRAAESWSRRVNGPFAGWYNEVHDRVGPLFAGRATIDAVRTENVGRLLAYIHNNPVRARVVSEPAASTWTSHAAYVEAVEPPSWLSIARGLELSGIARADFDSWVSADRSTRRKDRSLAEIDREAHRLGAIVLGTPKRDPLEVPLLSRPFGHLRPNPGRVIEIVCEVFGMAADAILERGRGPGAVARAVAIQAARAFGVSRTAAGDALGISPQAAAKLAARALDADTVEGLRIVCRRVEGELGAGLRKFRASPPKLAQLFEVEG